MQDKLFFRYSERRCRVTIFEARDVNRCIVDSFKYRPNARDHATPISNLMFFYFINPIIHFVENSFLKQLKENYIDYIIQIIFGFVLVYYLNLQAKNFEKLSFFHYYYNSQTKSINIQMPQDFNVIMVEWYIPGLTSTTTGKISNGEIKISDIVSEAETKMSGSFASKYPYSLDGFVRCVLINQFTIDTRSTSTQPLYGYPVMVKTIYTYKGEISGKYKEDLGVILINQSSLDIPIVSFESNLELFKWKKILASGNKEWGRILEKFSFDQNKRYIDDNGDCDEQYYSVPFVHVD